MSTDRELLEAAARAAGITIRTDEDGMLQRQGDDGWWYQWDPLTGDGEAFRLAVKLHLTLRPYFGSAVAQATVPGGPSVYITEENPLAPCAALRRAIVRAAAAIAPKEGQ